MAVIVTGCLGLVGSYVSEVLGQYHHIIGIDCDIRATLFPDISPLTEEEVLVSNTISSVSEFYSIDLRNRIQVEQALKSISRNHQIQAIVHCAAQPSHDWATKDPITDLQLNLGATLNLLETMRALSIDDSLFIYFSTNKVYGSQPNVLPLIEHDLRYDLKSDHSFYSGITEKMSIDNTLHSFFGCSKAAADIYVQEYSRHLGMKCVVLRGGCLTGGRHRGAKLHGFMNYLIKSGIMAEEYEVIGYKGKQVRDNLHARDIGELISLMINKKNDTSIIYPVVANLGGGRENSVSILELVKILEDSFGLSMRITVTDTPRTGDHMWYISDNSVLNRTYDWRPRTSLYEIIKETIEVQSNT